MLKNTNFLTFFDLSIFDNEVKFFIQKNLILTVLNCIINAARVAQLVEHCYFRTSQAPKTIQIHCN